MADPKKLALDKTSLMNFIHQDLAAFRDDLKKVATRTDINGIPPIGALLGLIETDSGTDEVFYAKHGPLAIGSELKGDAYTGADLIKKMTASIQSISTVYELQIKLFDDFDKYLTDTITKLMDAQHDSLDKIDGKTFLNHMGTLPGDFNTAGGGSAAGGDSTAT